MTVAHVVLLGSLMLAAAPDDPASLVQQLGAPRYVDREAAAHALEEMGRLALPELRAANESTDAEVRARAGELVTRIEAELLVRPTSVRLDFKDAPLPEVVAALAEQSGMPMKLVPEINPIWQGKRVTLSDPEPMTFWQALDRLCQAAELRHNVAQGGATPGGETTVQLYAGGPTANDLILDESGPFRISVQGIHLHRDRKFGGNGSRARIVRAGQAIVEESPPGTTSEQFYLDVQVVAEPRMVVNQSGPLTLVEAVDDQGGDLLPDPSDAATVRTSGYFGFGASTTTLQLQAHLGPFPARPANAIKTLRGSIPVIVAARKEGPLVIDLADAPGKTFQAEDVSLEVHEVRVDPDQPRTTIDLTLRPTSVGDPGRGLSGRINAELMALRSPNMPQSQIEILDAQGRAYHQWYPSSSRVDAEAARMTITLMNNQGDIGPPAQLRFYDMNRANTEVQFEFHDIPMP